MKLLISNLFFLNVLISKRSIKNIPISPMAFLLFALGLSACDSGGSSGGGKDDEDPISMPVVCEANQFPLALKTQIKNKLSNDFSLVPGAVVALYHPDHGYTIASFGVSDTSDDTPMPTDAVFDVGSIHKIIKWLVLEKLVDKDLLSFNDDINTYVSSPSITNGKVKDLPYHATGMVDIDGSVYDDIWARTSGGTSTFQYTYTELMAFLTAENDVVKKITNGFYDAEVFTLGSSYSYSSYGPVVAGEIARQITGDDPLTMLNEYVLDELLLTHTSFHGYDDIPDKLVLGYGNDYDDPITTPTGEHPQPNQNLMLATSSAVTGAIFSDACDLTHLSRAISEPSLNYLSKSIIDSRIASPRDVNGYLKIARGWMKYDSQYSGNFWVHAGDGSHGHSSLTGYNPDKKMSITVLTNFNPTYMDYNYGDEFAAQFAIVQLIEDFY